MARQLKRRKAFSTYAVDTSGENWMAPFADHLGIGPSEFASLRPLFAAGKSRVLLVEGPIDQSYFEYLKEHDLDCARLNAEIEVLPYGGKDTLKNTLLLHFVLKTFDHVFITYDLDAQKDVKSALERIGLKQGTNHKALGIDKPGSDCIEGVLPPSILSRVNGDQTDLVMQLGSANSKDRRKAKDDLKKLYLAEFKACKEFQSEELQELDKIVKHVNKVLK